MVRGDSMFGTKNGIAGQVLPSGPGYPQANNQRLIVTLLHALEAHNLKRGVAALCIGGGEATAIAVERIVH